MTSAGDYPKRAQGYLPLVDPEDLPGILAAASDVAFVISKTGVVQRVVRKESDELKHWQGRSLRDFLAMDSVPKLDDILTRLADGERIDMPVELNHSDDSSWPYPVRYTVHPIGADGDILLMGRDQSAVAETQKQLVNAQIVLERGYEERREYDARYRMLLASSTEPFLFVAARDGRIKDLNSAAAQLLGTSREELVGSPVAQEFKDRRRGEFIENLVSLSFSEMASELAVQTKRTRRDVTITPMVFRAAGEQLILCRLTPDSDSQHIDDRLSQNLNALYTQGKDAVVFTDTRGVIETANDAFLELVNRARPSDVKGRSLGDFMARSQIDLSVVLENATRSGHMRVYATRLTNEFGIQTPVEMSATHLNNRERPAVGFVIRDASRVEALRSVAAPNTAGPQQIDSGVAELVGSATLKEIVAETNEVIEKICIETAVDLTRNNRAAAAEMLGLSRQSLYVKLRKYGLLKKDED